MKRESVLLAVLLLTFSTGLQGGMGGPSDLGANPVPHTIVEEAPDPFGISIVGAVLDDPSPFGLVWLGWLTTTIGP